MAMRLAAWVAVAVAMVAVAPASTATAAQGVRGPLGDPETSSADMPSPRSTTAAKRARRHGVKSAGKSDSRADAKSAGVPADIMRDPASPDAAPPYAPPTSRAEHAAVPTANDPVSLGFKWQGNNDTAEKTRVQNYNGDATGTGAALGLNLHF